MAQIADTAKDPALGPATSESRDTSGVRWRRRMSIGAAVVVLGWSVVELASLAVVHTTGPEIYGVLVAFLAIIAGIASLMILRSSERCLWLTIPVLALWAIVGLGGLAGVVAHVVGPVA